MSTMKSGITAKMKIQLAIQMGDPDVQQEVR
jgi:hypothetical protein